MVWQRPQRVGWGWLSERRKRETVGGDWVGELISREGWLRSGDGEFGGGIKNAVNPVGLTEVEWKWKKWGGGGGTDERAEIVP